MASNGIPVALPAAKSDDIPRASGKPLPASGRVPPVKTGAAPVIKSIDEPVPKPTVDLQTLVAHLNRHLNTTGQPFQFRAHPAAGSNIIQEINPATDEVIGEYSAAEFPALAQGLGIPGLFVDGHA